MINLCSITSFDLLLKNIFLGWKMQEMNTKISKRRKAKALLVEVLIIKREIIFTHLLSNFNGNQLVVINIIKELTNDERKLLSPLQEQGLQSGS